MKRLIFKPSCFFKILFLLLLAQYANCQYSKTPKIVLKEKNNMVLMDHGDYDSMVPSIYNANDFLSHIFAVPENNAIGTNDIDNSISVLKFKQDEIDRIEIKKDFLGEVTGDYKFCYTPCWSENEIAYSQTRGFIIANLKSRHVETHTIDPGIDNHIGNVCALNGTQRTFVFEILSPYAIEETWKINLQIIKFHNDTFSILAEKPTEFKKTFDFSPWFVANGDIFIYNDRLRKLESFNGNFQPKNTVIASSFNEVNSSFRTIEQFAPHPSLPFAVCVEMGRPISNWDKVIKLPPKEYDKISAPLLAERNRWQLLLFKWNENDPKKRVIPVLSKLGSIWKSYYPEDSYSHFEFSPDGKWMIFRDESESSSNPCFVAVPVDPKNPLYFGKPIKLGKAVREGADGPTGTAWVSNPTAFVMCDGIALYKWDLGNINQMKRFKPE